MTATTTEPVTNVGVSVVCGMLEVSARTAPAALKEELNMWADRVSYGRVFPTYYRKDDLYARRLLRATARDHGLSLDGL